MNSWTKAGAYMGLAFIPFVSGYLGHWLGTQVDLKYGTKFGQLTGIVVGVVAGLYEVYRQAMRIERSGKG